MIEYYSITTVNISRKKLLKIFLNLFIKFVIKCENIFWSLDFVNVILNNLTENTFLFKKNDFS